MQQITLNSQLTFRQRFDALGCELDLLEAQQAHIDIPEHRHDYQPTLNEIEFNPEQQQAQDYARDGRSFVLIGPAGSGKTLTVNKIAANMLSKNRDINPHPLPIVTFRDPSGGTNDQADKPAIAFVAFTNRAVNNMYGNLRKFSPELVDELGGNFMTIHKLIEVAPEYYLEDGVEKMRFTPRRDELNRLPIKTLIIEEASMVDLELWGKLFEALEPDTQIILLGDLNQLPPVFGDSILNYGLIKLPIVELTHIYRQALDSPIIRQMHQVLKGHIPQEDTEDFCVVHGKSTKPVGAEKMGRALGTMLSNLHDMGRYDPMEDMVLTPYNKQGCGTIMLNKVISTWLDGKIAAKGEARTVYEIVAGMCRHYYAVGDLIYDAGTKMQGVITKIHHNGNFHGTLPQDASKNLSRFGILMGAAAEAELENDFAYNVFDIDSLTDDMEAAEQKVLASSHVITIEMEDGREVEKGSAGEVNGLDFGYCLTTHKAQGCEWRRVFVVIHTTHHIANREWLYTAGTRAKEQCTMMVRKDVLTRVVARQRIKGNTLDAKIESFNEGLQRKDPQNKRQITFERIN